MTIDQDVMIIAKKWGLDAALLQAVVNAEGDIIKAVRCSIPSIQTRPQALDVLARSATHAMSDFIRGDEHRQADFVAMWAARWAPVGAANDPKHLNANWPKNVLAFWRSFYTPKRPA